MAVEEILDLLSYSGVLFKWGELRELLDTSVFIERCKKDIVAVKDRKKDSIEEWKNEGWPEEFINYELLEHDTVVGKSLLIKKNLDGNYFFSLEPFSKGIIEIF